MMQKNGGLLRAIKYAGGKIALELTLILNLRRVPPRTHITMSFAELTLIFRLCYFIFLRAGLIGHPQIETLDTLRL